MKTIIATSIATSFKRTGTVAAIAAVVAMGMLTTSMRVCADGNDLATKVRIGFEIAPVKLNLAGKDPVLVGL